MSMDFIEFVGKWLSIFVLGLIWFSLMCVLAIIASFFETGKWPN